MRYKVNLGYKVCYKEEGSNKYIRHFLTYTYREAKSILNYYLRYPPNNREDNHKLKKPKWKVIPVSVKEYQDGIWREVPF